MTESHSFGALLRAYRRAARLTQLQVQSRLADQGYQIMDSTLSMWETGRRLPNDSAVFDFLGQVLHLTEAQEAALLDACLSEHTMAYLKPYWVRKEQRADGAA